MELSFLGAAGTVTGSKYLVSHGDTRLLVDCGLFQGVKALRLRNWKPLPFDPAAIDAVVLTHAHIDHSGHVPALVRDGFAGPVLCSAPTGALCDILLPDAGKLQEEDASYANRKGFSKHRPALPLYTEADARDALARIETTEFGVWHEVGSLRVRLRPAGHILGAASVEVSSEGRSVLFSGDLGRSSDLIMKPPEPPGTPDWLVVESTYGDRSHAPGDPVEAIAAVLSETLERGGVLLIPSFAVGRAQALLYCLRQVFERGLTPAVPVFLNSPMATRATEVLRASAGYHRLDAEACAAVCDLPQYVRSPDESRALCARRGPLVIVSASGMATGGRVLHHLKALAPDPRNTILLPGFMAPGTRGDALAHGVEAIKIHGEYVPVRARVLQLDMLSAHADQGELLAWVGACERAPREVFVTHGEPVAADTLRRRLQEQHGVRARAPELGETVKLG
ncbi:MAG: MBL fold metallo-hydrolase [Myxococcota bacterium]|nr:MBL fold metallo-hydrolase [Myxococcota bacterium]